MRIKPNPCRTASFAGCFLLFCLVVGISAGQCRRGCPKSDAGKLKYAPGTIYEYSFDSVVSIGIENANSEETDVKIKGNAKLAYEGNCGYTLALDDVQVESTIEQMKKIQNDLNKPVHFTMVNGELEPQICAEQNENDFALNMKRALISMFQTTENKYETDVFGICQTETTSYNDGGYEVITKLRNLNQCSYRENLIAAFAAGIVNENSGVKSRPFLNGEYTKEMKLSNGIHHEVKLTEKYNSPQEVKGKPVLFVRSETNLKLIKQHGGSLRVSPNSRTTSIIFHHPKNVGIDNFNVLRQAFSKTVKLVQEYAKKTSAKHFSELIRLMRHANVDSLIALSSEARNDLEKKVYFDALVRTATTDSLKAILKQINSWDPRQRKIAFMTLPLVNSIDLETLNTVAELIPPMGEQEIYLSVGTLVNTYCREHSCDNGEVNVITDKFAAALRNCKAPNHKKEDHVVAVLKGIRNVQHISESITQQLIECTKSQHSSRIRVYALQAYSSSKCNKNLQANAMNILRDRNEDSELRIEAYLAAVNCPNAQIANELSQIINSETVNQVGGFITSHLKAVRDSTDFTKASMKYHLGNIHVTKKFPIDPRRFSFNSEFSYAVDSLGLGAGADYSVIYSQKGFLPRSVRLNLTSEVFGTSFNTFDFSMRQENLENILEHFFGPKGFFSQQAEKQNQVYGGRSRRNVKAEADSMALQYKTYGSDNQLNNDINLDISMKIFGSEVSFLSLGDHIPSNVEEFSKFFGKAIGGLRNGLKKYDHKFQYHSLLNDVEIVYPLGNGYPLEVAIHTSTTGKLDFGIEFDLDQVPTNELQGKYRLKLIPSQDINFETFLRVDADVMSTGIRTSTNLHSADGGDVTVELLNGPQGFNVDLKLPRENVELIEIKHDVDFFLATSDNEMKTYPFKANLKKKPTRPVCFDQLQIYGLGVCWTANVPADTPDQQNKLPGLLNGPMEVSLILQTEKHIQFKGRYETNNEYQTWKFIYDTPGSKVSHETKLDLTLGIKPNLFGRINFAHPQMKYAVEGGLINDDKEIALYGQIEFGDEKDTQKVGFTKNGNEYRPLIEMKHHNQITNTIAGYSADGRIVVTNTDNGQKFTFDNLLIMSPQKQQTTINGWVLYREMKGFESELQVNRNNKNWKIDTMAKHDTRESVAIGAFITENNNPETKVGGSIALDFNPNHMKHELTVQTGKNKFEMRNALEKIDTEDEEKKSSKFGNTLKFERVGDRAPLLYGKLNGEVSKKLIQFDFEAARLDKLVSANMKLTRNQRVPGDFNMELKTKLNRHFAEVFTNIDVRQGKYIIDSSFKSSWGTQAKVDGNINQQITAQNAIIDLNGSFKLNNNDKQNTFMLKVNDVQDKFNSEFKLKRENVELISYNIDVIKTPEKQNSQVKFLIKDNLNLNFKFNLNNKNGRGAYDGTINLKKANIKPIKINGKFLYAMPKFNLDTSINFENEKIVYSTENELSKTEFSTKNTLDVGTEKFQFNAAEKKLDNERKAEFLIVLPTGRKFSGHFDKNHKTHIVKADLIDAQPDGKKRSLDFHGTIKKIDNVKQYYDIDCETTFSNFDEKKLTSIVKAKYLPKDDYSTAGFLLDLSGTALPENIKFNLNIDEFSKQHSIYRFQGNYGQKLTMNVNGNYHVKNDDKNREWDYEIQSTINAPETEMKTWNIASNGKYIQRLSPESNEIYRQLNIKLDHKCGNSHNNYIFEMQGNNQHGSYNINMYCPKFGKNVISGSWIRHLRMKSNDNDKTSGEMQYTTNVQLEKYGNAVIKMDLDFVENDQINLHYTIESSCEKLKNLDLLFKAEHSVENAFTTQITFKYNENQYSVNTITYTGITKYGIDWNIQTPSHQSKIKAIFGKLKDHHVKGDVVIEDVFDLDLISIVEMKYSSPEDFFILSEINSNKLNLNNVKANIKAENKAINLNINTGNGPLLNGNAQYNIKNDKNKVVIEGRGDVMYKNAKNAASFQLVRQLFNSQTDKETGFEYKFSGQLGPKNIISTLKATDKEFNIKLSGCEESKQCTNFEIKSVLTMNNNDIEHKLNVLINLRELGYPYEFELQSKSSKLGAKVKHDFETTITSNNNKKYKFSANIKPENNLIQIELPKRKIVLETINSFPENGLFGKYENSITMYLNKINNPKEKATISAIADLSSIKNELMSAIFELKFENPFLQKPLTIMGEAKADIQNKKATAKIEFDIFKAPNQKVIGEATATYGIKSSKELEYLAESKFYSTGLGFNYEASATAKIDYEDQEILLESKADGGNDLKFVAKLSGKKDKFDAQVIALNQQLFNMKITLDSEKHLIKTDSTYQIIGSKPIKFLSEFQPSRVKIVLKRDGLFNAIGEFIASKEARLQLTKGSDNKSLYNAKLSLDVATFLATTYDVNNDEIKDFMKMASDELSNDIKTANTKLSDRYKKSSAIVSERLKKVKEALPDFSKMIKNYKKNVQSIMNELEEDPNLKKLFNDVRQAYAKFMDFFQEFVTQITELYKKIEEAFITFYKKQEQLFNETILPAIKDITSKLSELTEFYTELLKVIRQVFDRAYKAWKNFENEVKELTKPLQEILKPFSEALEEMFKSIVKEWNDFWDDLRDFFKKLPSVLKDMSEKLSEQITKLRNVDELLTLVRDILQQLLTYAGTSEMQDFLYKLDAYIEAKLLKKPINDVKELEQLYYSFIRGINSLIIQLTGETASKDGISSYYNSIIQPITLSIETITKLPTWFSFKFSPLNYLRNERFDSFNNILMYNLPESLDFLPPFQLNGHIANGKHIITFDGRYIAFPGSCKYILAQDTVDNNFTVIANLQNGVLKSIILVDKEQYAEIDSNGLLKVNDKKSEYPVHDKNLHAWRRYYTASMLSTYGVMVKCTLNLDICHVQVNGFYTAKTRGLFGNGNSEPYDDYMKPTGEISENAYDFGNTYSFKGCSPVSANPQINPNKNEEICNDLFDVDSPLVFGYLFINRKPFHEACNTAVQLTANNKDEQDKAACNIALAYASAGRENNNLPLHVPKHCVKCDDNDGQAIHVGDEFTTQVPTSKADIILIVDTTLEEDVLNDLVQPIINTIRNQLKTRNLNDAHISVIGFNKQQKYPNLLTTNGKLNFNGKLTAQTLTGPKYAEIETNINYLKQYWELLKEINAPRPSELKALELALEYPFRPDAAKSILLIKNNKTDTKLMHFGAHVFNHILKTKGITMNYLGPIEGITVDGKSRENLVGFNKRAIAFLKGSSQLKQQTIDYTTNGFISTLVEDDSWVYSLNHFKELKSPEQKKQFASQISQTIADQLYKTEITNDCKCTLHYGLHGETSCTKKSYEFVVTKKPAVQKQG